MKVDISGITALTHDRDTSIRLYKKYKRNHPKQHPKWVVQKVIYDLERDRGISSPKVVDVRTRQGKKLNGKIKITWKSLIFGALPALSFFFTENRPNIQFPRTQNFALEQPSLYRQISTGAALTIQNEAPEPVTVTLKQANSGITHSFKLPIYAKGKHYLSSQTTPECSDDAPKRTVTLEPGIYNVTLDYQGTIQPESGIWTLIDGWEHFSCYFSVYHDNDND